MADSQKDRITDIVEGLRRREAPAREAMLPILHAVQAEFGCVDEAAVRQIASLLNLTRAEVHGVVSFYHDFRSEPHALPVIKLCRAEACKARGVETLVEHAEQTAAGKVAIETIYCLGLCSVGPAAMAGKSVHAALDRNTLDRLIGEVA